MHVHGGVSMAKVHDVSITSKKLFMLNHYNIMMIDYDIDMLYTLLVYVWDMTRPSQVANLTILIPTMKNL